LTRTRRLGRGFYRRDALEVAPDLLNKVLVHGDRAGRIVEVEAYRGADDPASHAYRGQTKRNRTMFGGAGHLYVYFTYGMHWCANVVTGEAGEAGAVLVRALAPVRGIDAMWLARPAARRAIDLANGPAKACQALALDGSFDGIDLVRAERGVEVRDEGGAPPERPVVGPRVGISAGTELRWRFSVPGDPHRSNPSP
jgi:DNA-3-methyladenine glycosylase